MRTLKRHKMQSASAADHVLAAGAVYMCTGEGCEIRALCGTLWVTQEGDGMDHVLEPGDRLAIERGGRVAVQLLSSGVGRFRCTAVP